MLSCRTDMPAATMGSKPKVRFRPKGDIRPGPAKLGQALRIGGIVSTADYELGQAPEDPRQRELWLQNLAGFIVWEDARAYALSRIDPAIGEEAKAAAVKAVNDGIYGIMMVCDGVTGGLRNADALGFLSVTVRYEAQGQTEAFDLSQGDGMCMASHSWMEGDFGVPAVAARSK
jgi:hypothetical protein